MQILVDLRLLGRGGASGIEEYTRNITRSLLAADKINSYSFFYNGFRKKSPEPRFSNIIDWHLPNKILDLSARLFSFPKVDRLIRTDLIFSPHFNILSVGRTPRIITFHDLSFLHHPQFFSGRQKFWHWLQDVRKQANAASHLVAVSDATKRDLVELLGVDPKKISVIYSGISKEFKPNRKSANSSTNPYILYLGTLEPRKNVPTIIKAFNLLKQKPEFRDWRLVLAGRPGWLYRDILREIKHSRFSKDIVLKGPVAGEERVKLYNAARVFAYPSFFEGFGFPPLEAQASGCPAIVADRTSLPEVVGDSAFRVNPWKPVDLAEIIELFSDDNMRNKMVELGLKNAARFSWEKTAAQTLDIFNKFR
ncbi:MAG: glycosyltransferase family 4 protein [Candidatus Harrisonbacteria bacterium]|nr:glycosyltransferase family 4 protein [Candidatus Harrisonbacteria bacterium]